MSGSGGVGTGGGAGTGSGGTTVYEPWIVFDSDLAGPVRHLFAIRPDGRDLYRVMSQDVPEIEPAVSALGTKLAYVTQREGLPQIDLVDLGTRKISPVTKRADGARRPALSPDGQRIAFRSGLSIFTIAVDGSDERKLATAPWTADFGGPAYSNDGQWIVYDNYNTIRAIHPDGTGDREIIPPNTGMQSFPTVSPDGTRVVFQVMCGDPPGVPSIWSVPFTGIQSHGCTGGRRLSPLPSVPDCMHPAWGPSNMVAWDKGKGQGDIVVWVADLVATITTLPSDDRNPAWSPVVIPPF
jgi:Tol biopolymer transport system component